jgi:hypothetical protein
MNIKKLLKKALKDLTEEIGEEPLSDGMIKEYLPDIDIIKYNDLSKYNSIEEVLPHNKSYKIILVEEKPNSGHWVCLLRYNDIIEYFDSYGNDVDYYIDILENSPNNYKYMSNLFDNTEKKVIYSKYKFQDVGSDINTCGRHIIYRIIQNRDGDLDLKNYIKNMKEYKKKNSGFSYDDIVSFQVNKTE